MLAVPHSAMSVGEAWSHVTTSVWWPCGNPGVELRYTMLNVGCFFVCGHDDCAPLFFCHLPAMSIKTTLHATAEFLYPCRRYPKCPWGLYASPPPVDMAVLGVVLMFPRPFLFQKKGFFPHT